MNNHDLGEALSGVLAMPDIIKLTIARVRGEWHVTVTLFGETYGGEVSPVRYYKREWFPERLDWPMMTSAVELEGRDTGLSAACNNVHKAIKQRFMAQTKDPEGWDPELGLSPAERANTPALEEARHFLLTLEQRERTRTDIRALRVGWNPVQGYFIEIPDVAVAHRQQANAGWQLPDAYQAFEQRPNVYARRYRTAELARHEAVALGSTIEISKSTLNGK